jgi:hypothetical protein
VCDELTNRRDREEKEYTLKRLIVQQFKTARGVFVFSYTTGLASNAGHSKGVKAFVVLQTPGIVRSQRNLWQQISGLCREKPKNMRTVRMCILSRSRTVPMKHPEDVSKSKEDSQIGELILALAKTFLSSEQH